MRFLPALLLSACVGGTADGPAKDTAADTATDGTDPVCSEPVEPPCVDEMILDLSLHDDKKSHGDVTTIADGDDFVTAIDASAGGYNQASNNAWTYVHFGTDGATKVDIDDETALESMDWDLALRRFIIRENSGDSGPSCVGAAALPDASYTDLDAVPEGVTFQEDDFYDDECVLVADDSGLPGSPDVAISGWWDYSSCLSMTGTPFVLQLADGRVIKLVIEAYYEGEGQDECNTTGSTTAEGGYISIRWSEL